MDVMAQVEEAALNAWTAPRQMRFDGWLLRFAGGKYKRSNSVNVCGDGRLLLDEKIDFCESVYTRMGQPTLFRLPAPFTSSALKSALSAAGYTFFDPTHVLTRPLDLAPSLPAEVTVRHLAVPEWIALRAELTGTAVNDWAVHRQILDVIVPEKALLGCWVRGKAVACGMGVVQGSFLGYFSIYTAASQRRRGFGRGVMAALSSWGQEKGASLGYLQVEGDNAPALKLYQQLGFKICYAYNYARRDK